MLRRALIVGLILCVILFLLGLVDLDPTRLAAREVAAETWWSGILPLLVGAAAPPLVGIALVVATRKLLLSLAIGTFTAAILVAGPNPLYIGKTFAVDYLWGSVADTFHLSILVFTMTLIGLVSVATKSGGTQGVVDQVLRFAKGVRGARIATSLMGLAVFFDDYANTALVGPTMRPLFDRLKLSREKLAYIIDSTAAPVAGLAIISTWVGTEVSYMQDAAASVGVTASGYALFFSALGFRFYCIFALSLVFIIAITGRDFGPMFTAEHRALTTGQVSRPGAVPLSDTSAARAKLDAPHRWYNAGVPIGIVLGIIVATIYVAGSPEGSGAGGVFSLTAWREAFIATADMADGNFLAYLFAVASAVGSLFAIGMPVAQGIFSLNEGVQAWLSGAKSMAIALAILVLAWALSAACKDLRTADYVGAALSGLSAAWVPLVVFLVAGVVAFATGTSWGTMAILIPTAAQVAHNAGGEAVMLVAMAAVLDGAIFGDHCSPISDTTVLSSICSGCDHLDHVRTQIPYAMLGAAVAGSLGYVAAAGFGLPVWAAYVLGFGILIGVVMTVGKPAGATGATAADPV